MCEIVSAATMASVFGEGAGALTVMQAAGAIGTVVSVLGAVQQNRGQQAMASYEAQQADRNRQVAELNAKDAITRGRIEEQAKRRETQQRIGAITASVGGSGVLLDGDSSASNIIGDTAQFGELDALTIKSNAEKEAYNFRVQGQNFAGQRDMALMKKDALSDALPWQAAGNLIAGASQVAEMNYRGSKAYRRSLGLIV